MFNEQVPSLTLKDRLNYPYYLGDAILTCNKSVLAEKNSERETIEATKNLRSLIPQSWEDDQFTKDLKKAKIKKKIDIRPIVLGNIRLREDVCIDLGVQPYEEVQTYDYEKLRAACINLLDRRNILMRREEKTIIP